MSMAEYMGKAIIEQDYDEQHELHYFFVLVAENGEPIAASEQYTAKHNAVDIIDKYFFHFEKVDKTGE